MIEVFGGSTSGSISVSLSELLVSVVPLLRIGSRANAVIAGNCDVHTSVARLFGFR